MRLSTADSSPGFAKRKGRGNTREASIAPPLLLRRTQARLLDELAPFREFRNQGQFGSPAFARTGRFRPCAVRGRMTQSLHAFVGWHQRMQWSNSEGNP